MNVKIELLTDAIFGSGASIPGGEDISVLSDEQGFPYLRGSTLKGLIRQAMQNYLVWTKEETDKKMNDLLGAEGHSMSVDNQRKITVSDFILPEEIRSLVWRELDTRATKETVLDIYCFMRTFTAIEEGMVKDGSLRTCRCITKGLVFYGTIECMEADEAFILDVLSCLKWIGSMSTRGFGKVKISKVGGGIGHAIYKL